MGPDHQDVMDKPSVTIGFAVDGAKPRVFHVPLSRFSWLVTLVLATLTWSAIATALLVYRSWSTPSPTEQVSVIAPTPSREALPAKAPPVRANDIATPRRWETIEVVEEEQPFAFDDSFSISALKLRRVGTQSLSLGFILANSDGEMREGNLWAVARFSDGKGKRVDVVSSEAAGIQKDGTTLDSRLGSRFAIRNNKARELELFGDVPSAMRLEKLSIGLRFLAEPDQKVLHFKKFSVE